MKQKFYVAMVLVLMVLMGAPACEVSAYSIDYNDGVNESFTIQDVYDDPLIITGIPAGDYVFTLTDTTGTDSSGFYYLSFTIFDGDLKLGKTNFTDSPLSLTFDDDISELILDIIAVPNFPLDLSNYTFNIKVDAAVPVPASVLLLGSGLVALTALKRRKQQ